jgi:dinuclear metal center YbgI/SA1388 family protein
MKLESVLQYVSEYLGVAAHPDYPTALNGLQVEGRGEVRHLCAAVDASEQAIDEAVRRGADLLVVHHGLFWDGLKPLTGRRFRKVSKLIGAGTGLYSVHLPLDSHAEVGNCALLARGVGLQLEGRFGGYQGTEIGWWGTVPGLSREAFRDAVAKAVGGEVRSIRGGPDVIRRVAVVTGGAGSMLDDAAGGGFDAFVTGEASHHAFIDAHESRINLYLAGHYATETFGVKALCEHLAVRFGLTWDFIDLPTGM